MTNYYFECDGLSVGYNGNAVVSRIKCGISKGEILTLIGPNGAGKSTVLKSIARQLSVIEGSVFLDGKDLSLMSSKEVSTRMAVLLTERMKSEMMTCGDIVATGRYPYTGYFGVLGKEDKQAVRDAMELVKVTDLADRDFTEISDGQRQRVMLARAIAQEPEIIILDEPTSFLDIRHKLEFLSVLEKMKDEKNVTVVMSMHELELAGRISDKILCLKGEYADRFGTPQEVMDKEYIRELFGIDTELSDFALSKGIEVF
ncbi:MAG: ABC transporter ATP-binding protein [Lachnospiraceae bacterium]|nr:ABC transporter ATP-binding protein [Lachnospiraceae bacterium]